MVDLHPPELDVHGLGHGPLDVVLRVDVLNIPLVEVDLVGVFQEDGQLLVVQTVGGHLAGLEQLLGLAHFDFQLPLVALIEDQVEEGGGDLMLAAETLQLLDPVVFDLHPGLELLLAEEAVFIGLAQNLELFVFALEIAVIDDRPLQLDDVGAEAGVDGPQDAAQAAVDGVGPAVLAEEAELHRLDLQDSAVILLFVVFDVAVLNAGEGDDLLHVRPVGLGLSGLGLALHGSLGLLGPAGLDLFALRVGEILAFQPAVLLLAEPFPLMLLGGALAVDADVFPGQGFLLLPILLPTPGQDLLPDLVGGVGVAEHPILPRLAVLAAALIFLALFPVSGGFVRYGFGEEHVQRCFFHITLAPG